MHLEPIQTPQLSIARTLLMKRCLLRDAFALSSPNSGSGSSFLLESCPVRFLLLRLVLQSMQASCWIDASAERRKRWEIGRVRNDPFAPPQVDAARPIMRSTT